MLAMEPVTNPSSHPVLEQRVIDIEARLRQQFADADRSVLSNLPVVQAYQRHYRAFGQTYHVLRQLESVALKGKSLASRGALVLAMFAVEVQTLLLTAGHDLDLVEPPLLVDRSNADERFVGIGGQEHVLRADDMVMRDARGIISAVINGPDERTRLTEQTRRALFTTYAPAGIEEDVVRGHLERIAELVSLVAPAATITVLGVYS